MLRKNISHSKSVLYKCLGALIRDYRQWREISQETLADSIGISVRQLQNWESDRRRARIENLHDLAEATGIPMQVCVALNGDQPIWYSLQKRRFAYSSIEAQYLHKEFFKYHEISGNKTFAKLERISTDKQIAKILACHQEIYATDKLLGRDVIDAAIAILPELNQIIFDSSGHYVGHNICLPLPLDVYQDLKKEQYFEDYLKVDKICNIISQGEGAFFYYSAYAGSLNVAHQMAIEAVHFLADVEHKERYLIAQYSAMLEDSEVLDNFGMKVVKESTDHTPDCCPKLYETGMDMVLGPSGPWAWLIKERGDDDKERQAEKPQLPGQPPTTAKNAAKQLQPRTYNFSKKISDADAGTVDGKNDVLTVDEAQMLLPDHDKSVKNIQKFDHCITPECCPNPHCNRENKGVEKRFVANGTYRAKDGAIFHRFICRNCGKSFSDKADTIFYGLRSPKDKVLEAFKLLIEGVPLRRIATSLGVEFRTVRHWLKVVASQSDKIDTAMKKALNVSQGELDALWTFVKKDSLRERALLWKESKTSTKKKDEDRSA